MSNGSRAFFTTLTAYALVLSGWLYHLDYEFTTWEIVGVLLSVYVFLNSFLGLMFVLFSNRQHIHKDDQ